MTVIIHNEEDGRIMKEGIRTVIAGKPNAGKSSLLNYMAGDEIAIVTDVAGTTRDTISESVRMNGVVLHITDTAGIHDTEDKVEKIGIRKAVDAVEKADLILFLMDSSSSVSEEDRKIAEMISERMEEGSHCIVLLNKNDLEAGTDISDAVDLFEGKTVPPVISCSLSTGDGLQELAELLEDMFRTGKIMHNNEIYLTNARQMAAMEEALTSMQLVRQSIEDGMSEDFFSIDLMTAYSALGRIIGEAVEDDLVEEIFSKFCLGK
jgi:tRNA modification GTPase